MTSPTLETAYGAFLGLLHATKRRYLVIGALAVGMIGEARLTRDLDFLIFLSLDELPEFLRQLKRRGFEFGPKKIEQQMRETGALRFSYTGGFNPS